MISPIHTMSDNPMSTSDSQESSSLVDHKRRKPCKAHLIQKGDAEPFPCSELLPHCNGDHDAGHIEQDEGDEGVCRKGREDSLEYGLKASPFFVLFRGKTRNSKGRENVLCGICKS